MKMKTSAMKTKRGSSLKDNPKGQSAKNTKKSAPKSRLLKTTPGFYTYSGDEVTKPTPKSKESSKGPRLMNGDEDCVTSHDENVVSQVQIVESKNRERLLSGQSHIQTESMRDKIRPTSPDMNTIPSTSEVRTPFNKRLISSTPDPEKLFSVYDGNSDETQIQTANVNKDKSSRNFEPQLVPERDTDTGVKSTKPSNLDVISSMLQTQRQNQVLWQQQLEQFKLPSVVKVTEGPSHSAFHQWKGLGQVDTHNYVYNTNSGLVSGEMRQDFVEENLNRAQWISEDSEKNEVRKTGIIEESNNMKGELDKESHTDPPSSSYNSYGATSGPVLNSVQTNIDDVFNVEKFTVQSQEPQELDAKASSKQPGIKKKDLISKSKCATNYSQDKVPVSSRGVIKTSTIGVKVLPVSSRHTQENSRDQTKSNMHRKVANKKEQKDKVLSVCEVSEPVKKKKVLHINLPRDERGMDVPPSYSSDDDDDDDNDSVIKKCTIPQQSNSDMQIPGNDSVSTCGEEVNSVLSKESERSLEIPREEPDPAMESEIKEMNLQITKADPNPFTSKVGVEYKLGDNYKTVIRNESDLDSYRENNTNENKMSIEKQNNEDLSQSNPLQQDDVMNGEKKNDGELVDDSGVGKCQSSENEAGNVNQNYHDYVDDDGEQGSHRSRRYRLHFLEKMADKTLMDIVCKLTLKATAIRDTELRDLIDDMIYNTDATLAREDGRFRSSRAFFMEENGKLKKRLHTVNKQLEAKERQERHADLYPGISNNDIMHMERKNLYLRQEKERLDNQVTNLLEEKAKWLIKQQDLVKTISLKDREILKLEGKFQEEKKTLHKAVDEAAKNSQGVHFKLSVADREISNLEQRLKSKDKEITELKTVIKDLKDDLQCCVDSRTDKNKEIQRLQDLVSTLKMGVDEVMKAYESSTHSQPFTSDQRHSIESLRRLVTGSLSVASSLSNIPERLEMNGTRRSQQQSQSHPENNDREGFTISTSTRQELPSHHHHPHRHHHHHHHHHHDAPPPIRQFDEQAQWTESTHHQQKSKRPHQETHRQKQQQQPQHRTMNQDGHIARDHHQAHRSSHRSTHRADTEDGVDWYAADSSSLLRDKDKGGRSRHDSGSALTVQALEDHNRRHSPIDRTLWHSLDTGHVMPPLNGEEPYHSDSEIHVANSKTRRRLDQERLLDGIDEVRDTYPQQQHQQQRRRKSDDFTDRKRLWSRDNELDVNTRPSSNGRMNAVEKFKDRRITERGGPSREREWNKDRLGYERSSREQNVSGVREGIRNFENERDEMLEAELESVTINNEDNDADFDRSRYSVSDYFKKYPQDKSQRHTSSQRQQQQQHHHHHQQQQEEHQQHRNHQHEKRFPMNSKDYWVDSGTADDPDLDETLARQPHLDQGHSREQPRSSFLHDEQYPSLESMSVSDQNLPVSEDKSRREYSMTKSREEATQHAPPSQRQQSSFNEFVQRSIRHGTLMQNSGLAESQRGPDRFNEPTNPLSSSYPTLRSEGLSSSNRPLAGTSDNTQYPSLLSTSLPTSSHPHHSERSRKENEAGTSRGLDDRSPRCGRDESYEQGYRNSEFNEWRQGENRPNRSSYRVRENMVEDRRDESSLNRNGRQFVTFREPSTEGSLPNQPSQSFQSDFLNGRTSFPPHSSPVNTSDISVSRRATRGSETSQQDFFRGTELSASYSSISDTDLGNHDYSNNNNPANPSEYGEESFNTGIASLDSKIAELEAKINRTKAVFS